MKRRLKAAWWILRGQPVAYRLELSTDHRSIYNSGKCLVSECVARTRSQAG